MNSSRIITSSRPQSTLNSSRTIRITTQRPEKRTIRASTTSISGNQSLSEQFTRLNQEIAQIQCEVKPLRSQYIALQNSLLEKQQKSNFNDEIDPEDDDQAVNKEEFQTAKFKFENESVKLQKQLDMIRSALSITQINTLEEEEENGKRLVQTLRMNIMQMDEEIDKQQNQINSYRLSQIYDTIQKQKDEIQKLSQELQDEITKHEQLRAQRDGFEESSTMSSEFAEDVNQIGRLKRKLEAARRKHFEKCKVFLQLRNKQLAEIEEVKAAINKDNLADDN